MWKQPWFGVFVFFWLLVAAGPAAAQYSEQEGESTEAPARQSGPNRGVGETVITPRPRPTQPPKAPAPEEKVDPQDAIHLDTEVNLVNVGAVVQDRNGNFIPGLRKEHFRVLEDGVPQTLQRVEAAEAAMTVAMVIEFSDLYWQFLYQTMEAAYGFVNALQPEDWIAVIAYDMRTEILQDFTRNKAAAYDALSLMRIPTFRESNLFDAVSDILERMQGVKGKKAILLIASGVDTFSRTRYDAVLKQVQSSDTPIYAIGTGQAIREWYDARGYLGSESQLNFLQADNQLRSFARLSGGRAYFPRFEGQFREIYSDISASLRNEYNLVYSPTNTAKDGKFRKIKVELVDQDGKPLRVVDEKGKEIKYDIRAREGYTAPRAVE